MTNTIGSAAAERLSVGGMELEVIRRGAGRPVLLLHGMQNVDPRARFLDLLGRRAEIIAPSHPGFGHSARSADFDTVYDLVHLYLDVLDSLPYTRVVLVGLSFGGWLAMVNVLVLRGEEGAKRAWATYRQARADAGLPQVSTDHFAYAALAYVGDTHEEGVRVGSKLLWFLNTSLKSAPQYSKFLPGAVPPQVAPQIYRTAPQPMAQSGGSGGNGSGAASAETPVATAGQNAGTLIGITAEQAMARGILFAGSPDTVYQQIRDFYEKVGGFGHLVMIGRSGFMTHAEAEKGIKLFAKEVLPRLREIAPVTVG